MDQKLKERVFGALVVVAIAVIFIPMVLDKKHEEAVNLSEGMPTPPLAGAGELSTPPQEVTAMESSLSQDVQNMTESDAAAFADSAEAAFTEKPVREAPTRTASRALDAQLEQIPEPAFEPAEASSEATKPAKAAAVSPATLQVRKERKEAANRDLPPITAQAKTPQQALNETEKAFDASLSSAEPQVDLPKEIPIATLSAEDDFMAANDETGMIRRQNAPRPALAARTTEKRTWVAKQEAKPTKPAVLASTDAKPKPVVVASTTTLRPEEVASAKPMTSGWAVQMGTFANHSNAAALERKLKDKGYAVFLHEVAKNDRKLIRVLVGPEVKRQEADKLLSQLEQNAKVKGMVIRYEPLA